MPISRRLISDPDSFLSTTSAPDQTVAAAGRRSSEWWLAALMGLARIANSPDYGLRLSDDAAQWPEETPALPARLE
jgi:hypothetical protein